ncbi:hypothetical protein ABIA39_003961 [Nocardia sp. GAS34]|uniref:WXG100 family type VII secretion target n=1 Tax=unclassified Nocardia TaxID=2637762 RepID=UPI003D1F3A22
MAELWADPDRLRAVSPHFEQLGEEVNTALAKLKHGLQAEGHCWGTDGPGKQFEKGYPQGEDAKGGPEATIKVLAAFVDRLKSTGDKITTTANGLQQQDQQNAATLAQQAKKL